MGQMIQLTADDGHRLSAYRVAPTGTPKAGLVVAQEIFGVNHHIQNMCDRFAADGYVALAPAIFDRVEPGITLGYTADDIERGRSIRGKVDIADMVRDVKAAVDALKAEGRSVGVVGYCLGGTLAWLACTRIDGVKAAVGFTCRVIRPKSRIVRFATTAPEPGRAFITGRMKRLLRVLPSVRMWPCLMAAVFTIGMAI